MFVFYKMKKILYLHSVLDVLFSVEVVSLNRVFTEPSLTIAMNTCFIGLSFSFVCVLAALYASFPNNLLIMFHLPFMNKILYLYKIFYSILVTFIFYYRFVPSEFGYSETTTNFFNVFSPSFFLK